MSKNLGLDIQNQLARYIVREMSLRDFRNWFDSATWDVQLAGDPEAIDIAGEIELRLSEFSNGHWTEEELLSKLTPLVKTYNQKERFWGESRFQSRTSSGSSVVTATFTVLETDRPGLSVGRVIASESV